MAVHSLKFVYLVRFRCCSTDFAIDDFPDELHTNGKLGYNASLPKRIRFHQILQQSINATRTASRLHDGVTIVPGPDISVVQK